MLTLRLNRTRSLFIIGSLTLSMWCHSAAAELAGKWTLSIDTPRGTANPVLEIVKTDETYSGQYHGRRGTMKIDAIETTGNTFSFPLVISVPIGDIEVEYTGTFDDKRMEGVARNPRGAVPFTGVRTE